MKGHTTYNALLGAITLAALGGSAMTEPAPYRVRRTPGAFGNTMRRPKPRRYFGGRSGRKLTRLLRRRLGERP